VNALARVALVAAASAALAVAQATPRPAFTASANNPPVERFGWGSYQVAAPEESLPPAGAGQFHTAKLVYVVYLDVDPSGDAIFAFRRSGDGGFSWSQPTTIWTNSSSAGEFMWGGEFKVAAQGHHVYVIVMSNRGHPRRNGAVHLLGSDDQGQTWYGPLMLSTGMLGTGGYTTDDPDDQQIAVSQGVAHVVWGADYYDDGTGSRQPDNDIFYASAQVSGGQLTFVTNEIRVDDANGTLANGDVDSAFPSVAAEGTAVVHISWQDDRIVSAGGGTGNDAANNVYSRTSLAFGTDFGNAAATPEHDHTGFTSPINNTPRRSTSVITGQNIYIVQEDQRVANDDDVWISISNNAGQTWTDGVLVAKSPSGTDSDDAVIAADGDNIVVGYRDNRGGQNKTYAVVDNNKGADFVAGTHKEYLLSPNSNQTYRTCGALCSGEVMCVYYEDDLPLYQGQDWSFGYSTDAGASWQTVEGINVQLTTPDADVDDPHMTITHNRDLVATWIDDAAQGNAFNLVYLTGIHVPRLVDETATGKPMKLVDASPGDQGDLAVLFPSLQPPTPQGYWLDPTRGIELNFTPDSLTIGAVGALQFFVGTVDAAGAATFPFVRIDFAKLIGQDIYYAAATWDGRRWVAYTDTIHQSK
jgi:hypothetical protein